MVFVILQNRINRSILFLTKAYTFNFTESRFLRSFDKDVQDCNVCHQAARPTQYTD
jgi:hypothetical protein